MSKVLKQKSKNIINKTDHWTKLRVMIPAGMASTAPPLGSQLAQRGINMVKFCNEFNERTANIREGIPLPCRVKPIDERTYNLVIHQPPATYFLKQAAGLEKGSFNNECFGKITLKHVYEIAKIKSQDPPLTLLSLQQVCQMLIGIAKSCGIKVTKELTREELTEIKERREQVMAEYLAQLQEEKEAKLRRARV